MSSKERLQRLALEAELTAKEKAEKKKVKAVGTAAEEPSGKVAPARKKAVAAPKRQKLVWKVFNASYKEVGVFPYPQKAEADAMCTKLQDKSGQPHFVNAVSVPME
jgi:hypothetical protein